MSENIIYWQWNCRQHLQVSFLVLAQLPYLIKLYLPVIERALSAEREKYFLHREDQQSTSNTKTQYKKISMTLLRILPCTPIVSNKYLITFPTLKFPMELSYLLSRIS